MTWHVLVPHMHTWLPPALVGLKLRVIQVNRRDQGGVLHVLLLQKPQRIFTVTCASFHSLKEPGGMYHVSCWGLASTGQAQQRVDNQPTL